MEVRRRSVLAAAGVVMGAGAVGGCVTPPDEGPVDPKLAPMADAHVHLFNAADLPAGKFVQYVVIPDRWPGHPPFVAAIADIVVNVLKRFVVPVRNERIRAVRADSLEPDVSPERFDQAVRDRIRQIEADERAPGFLESPVGLLESYRELTEILAADAGRPIQPTPETPVPGARGFAAARRDLAQRSAGVFAEAARKAHDPGPGGPGVVLEKNLEALPFAKAGGQAARLVGWAFLMMQSRQHHLAKYLADFTTAEATPRLIVHHLVDYDLWLGDGPIRRSGHLDQIEFWAGVATARAKRVELKTFAPFCPLKHAVETAERRPTTLARLQQAYDDGKVAGFKIYPPMGFRATNNIGIGPELARELGRPISLNEEFMTRPGEGQGRTAVNRWEHAAGKTPLAPALDISMAHFLAWARSRDVPLMAHAGPGNEAGKGFGRRANPKWWEAAAGPDRNLRLSIGHLVQSAEPFVKAVRDLQAGRPVDLDDPNHWALDAPLRMMRPRDGQPSLVFGDLGYMPELTSDPALAVDFFKALKAAFGRHDPDLRQILYGTDWIMLAIEANDAAFPEELRKAMRDADIGAAAAENISWRNARRFLKLDPA
jgi:hypothetical protein